MPIRERSSSCTSAMIPRLPPDLFHVEPVRPSLPFPGGDPGFGFGNFPILTRAGIESSQSLISRKTEAMSTPRGNHRRGNNIHPRADDLARVDGLWTDSTVHSATDNDIREDKRACVGPTNECPVQIYCRTGTTFVVPFLWGKLRIQV
jgi:hypothetical protein